MECAISRATKEKRVAELEEALKNSSVAFGVRYNKVSVSACTIFNDPRLATYYQDVKA